MKCFAWDFMSVDEGAPVSVDGYKAKRTGRAAEIAPVGGGWGHGGGRRKLSI